MATEHRADQDVDVEGRGDERFVRDGATAKPGRASLWIVIAVVVVLLAAVGLYFGTERPFTEDELDNDSISPPVQVEDV